MSKAAFITLEGIEGAGKSTQLPIVKEWVERQGHDCLVTREPGGTPMAEQIRAVLIATENTGMSALSELLLMFAARDDHLQRKIIPALKAGTWVVSDRFVDASHAYQGGGRGLPAQFVNNLEQMVVQDTIPDLVLLYDLPPAIGLERARKRNPADRFEGEGLGFFDRARAVYLHRAEAPNYRVIDADAPVEVVRQATLAALDDWALGQKRNG